MGGRKSVCVWLVRLFYSALAARPPPYCLVQQICSQQKCQCKPCIHSDARLAKCTSSTHNTCGTCATHDWPRNCSLHEHNLLEKGSRRTLSMVVVVKKKIGGNRRWSNSGDCARRFVQNQNGAPPSSSLTPIMEAAAVVYGQLAPHRVAAAIARAAAVPAIAIQRRASPPSTASYSSYDSVPATADTPPCSYNPHQYTRQPALGAASPQLPSASAASLSQQSAPRSSGASSSSGDVSASNPVIGGATGAGGDAGASPALALASLAATATTGAAATTPPQQLLAAPRVPASPLAATPGKFVSAYSLWKHEQQHPTTLSTGCSVLDACLGGGVPVGSITEVQLGIPFSLLECTKRVGPTLTYCPSFRCLVRLEQARPSWACSSHYKSSCQPSVVAWQGTLSTSLPKATCLLGASRKWQPPNRLSVRDVCVHQSYDSANKHCCCCVLCCPGWPCT